MLKIRFFGNLPQTRFVTTFRFALGVLTWLVLAACFLAPAKAAGPLSVASGNPWFFVDSNGKAIYLTGVHLNNDLVYRNDKAILDFTSYLNFFAAIRTQLRTLVGVGTSSVDKVRQRLPLIRYHIRGGVRELPSMAGASLI